MVEFVNSLINIRNGIFPVGFDEPGKGDKVAGVLLSSSYADCIGDLSLSYEGRNEDGIILSNMILEEVAGFNPRLSHSQL